jgi:hypothetical protein
LFVDQLSEFVVESHVEASHRGGDRTAAMRGFLGVRTKTTYTTPGCWAT